MRFLNDVDLCTCSFLSVTTRYVCSSFCPFIHSSTIHPSFLFYFFFKFLFWRYWMEVKSQCRVNTCKMLVLFFTMLRCQVEGCNRGFDSAPRLRRHMKIHNKGECDQIVWLFYIVPHTPTFEMHVLFFHVISRCLVVDFSFTYFGRKKGGQNDTTTGYSLCARSFDFWYINNFWVKTLHACSSWSIRYVIPNYIIYWMFFPYFLSRICVQCTWMCWNLWQIF